MIFPPSLETWAEPNLEPDYPGPATAQILGRALGYGQGGGIPGMGRGMPGWMNWSQGVQHYGGAPSAPSRPPFQPTLLPPRPPFQRTWPPPRPPFQPFQPFRFPPGYEQQFQPFRLPPSLPYPYNLSRFPWSTPGAMPREALPPLPALARYPQAPTAPLVPPEAQVAPRREEGATLRRARRKGAAERERKEAEKLAIRYRPTTEEGRKKVERIAKNISLPGGL